MNSTSSVRAALPTLQGPGPYLHLTERLKYCQIKWQELLLNVAGPKRSFCARNLQPKIGRGSVMP